MTKKKKDLRESHPQRVTAPASQEDNALPHQAFAIVGSREDPATWQLPHHTSQVKRAAQGKIGYEHTIDWQAVEKAVALVSLPGIEGQRVVADESQILAAAQHLAAHYRKAGKPLPDALAVLV